jgi:hypothetical protein
MTDDTHSTPEQQSKGAKRTNVEAIEFLQKLRSAPWLLVAISPEGVILAKTVSTVEQADKFVGDHNNRRNLYYGVNPSSGGMNKKPTKADITAIEYQLADLDPVDGESSETAKARYLNQLGTFSPTPSAVIDSGNGIQCLWKLAQPIALGEGRDKAIAEAEARSKALMERLGAKAGTQNIDRILRLPGTTNLPNAVKLKQGRVACPTKLLAWSDVSYTIEAIGPAQEQPKAQNGGADIDALPVSDRIKNLIRGIDDPEYEYAKLGRTGRSEAMFAVVMAMVSGKCRDQLIQDVMFDRCLPIGEHVRDQPNPADYLVRQIRHALAKIGGPNAAVREVKIKARMEDVLK